MRRKTFVVAAVALLLGAASTSPGCRNATQVTVELRTVGSLTCAQLKGVAIVVAQTPADAEDKMRLETLSAQVTRGACGADPRLLGTLVLTPSGSTGAIVVRARVSDAPESTCKPPDYKGCIVSRRAFAFIDHTSVTMPIGLELSCADVPCDVVSSCRSGTCVSSKAECLESSGTCESAAQPVVLPDGGVVSPRDGSSVDAGDAAVADSSADAMENDAALDAGTASNTCPTPAGDVDCFNDKAAPVCCFLAPQTNDFGCTASTTCPGLAPRFFCTGRKHCKNSELCCGIMGMPPSAQCATPAACAMSSILCNVPEDCPASKPKCTGNGPSHGPRQIHTCE